MTVQAATIDYKGPNQTGETSYGYLAQADRYGHANSRDLQESGFYEQIKSVRLFVQHAPPAAQRHRGVAPRLYGFGRKSFQ
ncbi:hypothetical protein [Nocardia goodfellowii]|uniref:Uncharacterized protein n=1 Tax=Nocardia goodfellowii TaxID=882446 RepID=A0ABS4QPF8_9NOCA|nr:hypothetical protein [Nocardia goodfellowii]MBP2192983.1 hypothetical protein [Nocardia goodfellowii]